MSRVTHRPATYAASGPPRRRTPQHGQAGPQRAVRHTGAAGPRRAPQQMTTVRPARSAPPLATPTPSVGASGGRPSPATRTPHLAVPQQHTSAQPETEPSTAETEALPSLTRVARQRPKALLKVLGPGLIAGASDNDPTSVASLSVIGATTGYALSWLVILVIPMLMIVQAVSASVGVVARGGLEDVIRKRFGKGWAV